MNIVKGRIIKKEANTFVVDVGEMNISCTSQKKLKQNGVFVGDIVDVDLTEKQIVFTHSRKNKLLRPPLANIDNLLILITSKPKPDFYLLDKLILFCKVNGITPVICHSKSDLGYEGFEIIKKAYGKHFIIKQCSSMNGEGVKEVLKELKGSVSAVAGQSGVGKSALLNALAGREIAVVGDLSHKIERGVNTTRNSSLYELAPNTYLVDTAGFSALDETFLPLKAEELAYYYPEFVALLNKCKYSSCTHIAEPDCAVKTALKNGEIDAGRYERYLIIYETLKNKRY